MKVLLTAFDRLHGEMTLPDNWDHRNDIHLPFPNKIGQQCWDGGKMEDIPVGFKTVVFRFTGHYSTIVPNEELMARYHLIDILK